MLNFNELCFLCCDSFYLLELTLKMQVSNTMNTIGISSNDKYLLLLLLQLMLKVPSISTHAGSQMSMPPIHSRALSTAAVLPVDRA